ncbi:nucleosome-remodeling factor subunit NURF301 isoform X2 [Hydra vulgaris]|uniref:Nucleosome-remodeling factor subunit NURF301 isoform X2 n=1 Tax=Hydra vulgaris TaxID=6087 RepID=A0ABM4BI12_HYDVU
MNHNNNKLSEHAENESLEQKLVDYVTKPENEKESIKQSPTLLQSSSMNEKLQSFTRLENPTSRNDSSTSIFSITRLGMTSVTSKLVSKWKPTQSNQSLTEASMSKITKQQSPLTRKTVVIEPNYVIAKNVLDSIIRKVEKHDRKEKRKHEKMMSIINKLRAKEFVRRQTVLMVKRNNLRYEIMRKREIMEALLIQEVEKELFPKLECILNLEKPNEEEGIKMKLNKKVLKCKRKTSKRAVDVIKKKKSVDTKVDLYCICRTPFDETQFYVGCDLCNGWFHGSCIDITEEEAESIDKYICELCNKQKILIKEEELYCICRQPYDENKIYIGCEMCKDWFHNTCVGMTNDSPVKEYKCSKCRKKTSKELVNSKPLTRKELDGIKCLHKSLINHEFGLVFMKPVYKKDLKDYHEKSMMDLQTMGTKLRTNNYSTLANFVDDVFKIFDDFRYHNPSDLSIYRCAEVLEIYFVQMLNEFKNTFKKR